MSYQLPLFPMDEPLKNLSVNLFDMHECVLIVKGTARCAPTNSDEYIS